MMREIIIDGTIINDESDCFIIAEIGHNHQGKINIAKDMITVAKRCGVDAFLIGFSP